MSVLYNQMKYSIDNFSSTPIYLQLYHLLRADIVDGVFPFGSKLPSKRLMAEELEISIISVAHAYDLLSDEGYIETRQRSGCFVIFREGDFQSIDAVPSEPSLPSLQPHHTGEFPFSVLAKTVRKVLLDYGDRILVRLPNSGCLELKNEICAYLSRSRSFHVNPSQLVIGAGAEYLYGLIAQLLADKKTFALESPSYEKIRRVYESCGIQCDMLPLRPDGIDSAELERTEAAVLHTTPFSSYPSGITVSGSKKHEYLSWAEKRQGLIIEDNYDSELTVSSKQEDTLFAMSKSDNVIYVNTFSKTIAPSMRIGYMVLPEALAEEFERRLGFYSCTVPALEQYVLAELLHSGDFERHVNRVRRKKRKALQAK